MLETYQSLIGVIIGGIITWIATIIAQLISNKHSSKLATEQKKHEIETTNREVKRKSYVEIANLISVIKAEISVDECANIHLLIGDGQEKIKNLSNYFDDCCGIINLYFPKDISKALEKFRVELYTQYKKEYPILENLNGDNQQVLQMFIYDIGKLQVSANKILDLMRKDLETNG